MKGLILGIFLMMTSFSFAAQIAKTQAENGTILILLGPPGSGKGTQAMRITKDLNIPHISTGDLFRENIAKDTALGKEAKAYMNEGKLVPDDLVLRMLLARVALPDSAHGYLLDGFPRTVFQAEEFDRQLTHDQKVIVINLEVADESIVQRMAGRLICKTCGAVYNSYSNPPQQESLCDKEGGTLYQRDDDRAEVVEERLRVYHAQTKPVIQHYQQKGWLHTINGEQQPEKVYQDVMHKIKAARK